MGINGVRLYQNDVALDTKDSYIEKIRDGKSNEESLKEIIEENKEIIEDYEDGPVFWLALSETMWQLGRLTAEVKEKALKIIDSGEDLKTWKGYKEYESRKRELERLKEKLNKEMPKEKKLRKKEVFNCGWKEGDVYAYQIKSEDTEYKELVGRYLIFRKVGEREWYPNSIVPIVYAQITKNNKLPKKEELNDLEYIIISNYANVEFQYKMTLLNTSKRVIPKDIIYIGSFSNNYFKLPENEYQHILDVKESFWPCSWKNLNYLLEGYKLYGSDKSLKINTNKKINLSHHEDIKIRYKAKVLEFENALDINIPKGTLIEENDLLYTALSDTLAIGGIVRNKPKDLNLDENRKKETEKRIHNLQKVIKEGDYSNKEEKLRFLEEAYERIMAYDEGKFWKEIFKQFK